MLGLGASVRCVLATSVLVASSVGCWVQVSDVCWVQVSDVCWMQPAFSLPAQLLASLVLEPVQMSQTRYRAIRN